MEGGMDMGVRVGDEDGVEKNKGGEAEWGKWMGVDVAQVNCEAVGLIDGLGRLLAIDRL